MTMTILLPRSICILATVVASLVPAIGRSGTQGDSEMTLWYTLPAANWEREALPIGNGRMGAMIFGGLGRDRIALNEESVWSGSRAENNRQDAARNLPEIRRLLLAGKNVEAETLVDQTFTCQGAGSGRGNGAGVPFGCYQSLGDLNIVWHSAHPPISFTEWKWSVVSTGDFKEAKEAVGAAVKLDLVDQSWKNYIIADGKAVQGGYDIQDKETVVLRHRFQLTAEQVGKMGVLRIGPADMNGSVYVNAQNVGGLEGWQAHGNALFKKDVRQFLKVGDNVVALVINRYRRHGRFPLVATLEAREEVEDYHRALNLGDALATVRYKKGGVNYTREAFSSAPDQVMVFKFAADRPGAISFTADLERIERYETVADGANGLLMTGQLDSGVKGLPGLTHVTRVRAIPVGGKVSVVGGKLRVEAADEVVLLVAAATNYQGFAGRCTADPLQATKEDLTQASTKPYARLLAAHIADYHTFFNRVSMSLGDGSSPSKLPTDQRLAALASGGADPALAALYFNFGRYLLISSSRPGTMPANLQGIWAEGIQTAWNCDYHLDINVQMNYWPAEVCGLGECHLPLLKLIESLQKPGGETAKAYYNAKGWVAHVITNIWGFTAPGEKASWGATASGSAWLCQHLWEHYSFGRDKEYLKWAYPIMKGSAEFYLDMLITDPKTGWLVTAPSNSPENAFKLPDRTVARICMGPTMDMQLLRELFGNCIESATILGGDDTFRARLVEARAKLAPTRIGKHGQIMEWLEDYDEPEPNHRHVSSLYGLHPYDEITREGTPELAKAARITLERRGDASTGWSMAWKSNFWARLHDGNHAHQLLKLLITKGGKNLFCLHPPFQIDGNFGGTAAIAEMLVQSQGGMIRLLPALPAAWPEGKVTGLRARGGYEVDIEWKNGILLKATVRGISNSASDVIVGLGDRAKRLPLVKGGEVVLTPSFFESR